MYLALFIRRQTACDGAELIWIVRNSVLETSCSGPPLFHHEDTGRICGDETQEVALQRRKCGNETSIEIAPCVAWSNQGSGWGSRQYWIFTASKSRTGTKSLCKWKALHELKPPGSFSESGKYAESARIFQELGAGAAQWRDSPGILQARHQPWKYAKLVARCLVRITPLPFSFLAPPEDIDPNQGNGLTPNQDIKTGDKRGSSKEPETQPPHAVATEDATPEPPTATPNSVPPSSTDKPQTLPKTSSPKETEPTTTPYETTKGTDPAKTGELHNVEYGDFFWGQLGKRYSSKVCRNG